MVRLERGVVPVLYARKHAPCASRPPQRQGAQPPLLRHAAVAFRLFGGAECVRPLVSSQRVRDRRGADMVHGAARPLTGILRHGVVQPAPQRLLQCARNPWHVFRQPHRAVQGYNKRRRGKTGHQISLPRAAGRPQILVATHAQHPPLHGGRNHARVRRTEKEVRLPPHEILRLHGLRRFRVRHLPALFQTDSRTEILFRPDRRA